MAPEQRFAQYVRKQIEEDITLKQTLLAEGGLLVAVEKAAEQVSQSLRAGSKVLLLGNGGSAAAAQHIAAELVGRYRRDRRALAAIALTVDTSALTAISNDYGFERVFARQVEALGAPGDVAIALSTSGNSPNILCALEAAKVKGMITIGLTGRTGGKMKPLADFCLQVPADETPRIQETHLLLGHILCGFVEEKFTSPRP